MIILNNPSMVTGNKQVELTPEEVREFYPLALIAVGTCPDEDENVHHTRNLSWTNSYHRFRDGYFETAFRMVIMNNEPGSVVHFRFWTRLVRLREQA